MHHQILLLFVAVSLLLTGCQSQPEGEPSTESPPPEQPADERRETIEETDEKVNKQNGLEKPDTEQCPPPRSADGMCAQVVVWALSPNGTCCEYPTPCQAPEDWETYQSVEACREAAGGGETE